MKRFISILLIAATLLSLSGCGKSKSIAVTYGGDEKTRLKFDMAEDYPEDELTLKAVFSPWWTRSGAKWTSSDEDVVKVTDNGKGSCTLELRHKGEATVKVACGDVWKNVKVKVADTRITGAFLDAEPGDYITFGSYEQDNDPDNGAEPIEWLVLSNEDDKLTVISRYGLDTLPFDKYQSTTEWEKCTLRTWLNEDFLAAAFSEDEADLLVPTDVEPDLNPVIGCDPGELTQDRVFILSYTEANEYFSSSEERQCLPTEYAIAMGAGGKDDYQLDGRRTCWWWLRTPGYIYPGLTAYVGLGGKLLDEGTDNDEDNVTVRPVVVIDIG